MRNWAREELLVAKNLYCTIPFGQFHSRNSTIVEIAKYLGRTPDALAMKLCNFASLDQVHRDRGVKWLSGASSKDREIWAECQENWEELVIQSELQLSLVKQGSDRPSGREEVEEEDHFSLARTRVRHGFFCETVLSAYENRCCITGLLVPELLNASHIVPWVKDKRNRLNPHNGLCLNVLHKRVFDRGLITVTPDLTVRVSPLLEFEDHLSQSREFLHIRAGDRIHLPNPFPPFPEFLDWHNHNVFRK